MQRLYLFRLASLQSQEFILLCFFFDLARVYAHYDITQTPTILILRRRFKYRIRMLIRRFYMCDTAFFSGIPRDYRFRRTLCEEHVNARQVCRRQKCVEERRPWRLSCVHRLRTCGMAWRNVVEAIVGESIEYRKTKTANRRLSRKVDRRSRRESVLHNKVAREYLGISLHQHHAHHALTLIIIQSFVRSK